MDQLDLPRVVYIIYLSKIIDRKHISVFFTGPPNIFLLENILKKTTDFFLKFIFLFVSTILPVDNGK